LITLQVLYQRTYGRHPKESNKNQLEAAKSIFEPLTPQKASPKAKTGRDGAKKGMKMATYIALGQLQSRKSR
jgi:hypothetical protein